MSRARCFFGVLFAQVLPRTLKVGAFMNGTDHELKIPKAEGIVIMFCLYIHSWVLSPL